MVPECVPSVPYIFKFDPRTSPWELMACGPLAPSPESSPNSPGNCAEAHPHVVPGALQLASVHRCHVPPVALDSSIPPPRQAKKSNHLKAIQKPLIDLQSTVTPNPSKSKPAQKTKNLHQNRIKIIRLRLCAASIQLTCIAEAVRCRSGGPAPNAAGNAPLGRTGEASETSTTSPASVSFILSCFKEKKNGKN